MDVVLKGDIMSLCNINLSNDANSKPPDINSTSTLTQSNLNPQNCMDQQNNMNQQNCLSSPISILVHSSLQTDINDDLYMITNTTNKEFDGKIRSDPPQKTKKEKKEKLNKSQWRKEKGNKYLNKPYRNYKGVEIKSKEFVDYDCKCSMKCKDVLPAKDRKQEFQKFWELGSYEAQAIFLIARVDEQTTKSSTKKKKERNNSSKTGETTGREKRKRRKNDSSKSDVDSKDDDSSKLDENSEVDDVTSAVDSSGSEKRKKKNNRQFSRTYILKSRQVCRDMFVKTLGITSKRINTALVKMRSRSLVDHRGLSQGGKNKISEDRYDEVVQHIKKMPRYKCIHMQDKHDNDFMNLPPELSLSKMYELYTKEVENPVSLSMYKKVYYGKFNFKAKGVKRETCNICKGDRKIKNAELKKQQILEKRIAPCSNPEIILPDQYSRVANFANPPPSINCSQSWFPTPNFQMPQHNPHYFDQSIAYDMN